jgi:hypothetical protein
MPEFLKEFLTKLITNTDKAFSMYVLFIMSIITVPITLKEAFTKSDIVYYEIKNGFIIDKMASYHVSLIYSFIIFLIIIHANKLLIILSDLVGLIIPAIELKLGIYNPNQHTRKEDHQPLPNENTEGVY